MVHQSFTASPDLFGGPDRSRLKAAFVGKALSELRTPCFVIDRDVVDRNCAKMHERAERMGMGFRAHVKTLKSAEVMRHQLKSAKGSSSAIVCSTMPEVLGALHSNLVEEGILKDIMLGIPLPLDRIAELAQIADTLQKHAGHVRILIDHPRQLSFLEEWTKQEARHRRWSVFVKCDAGGNRAGLPPQSEEMRDLIQRLLSSTCADIFGFYCHNGASYASSTPTEAATYLTGELAAVNDAAGICLELRGSAPEVPYVLAMGSTPAAHCVMEEGAIIPARLNGVMELHAGCYPACDLQQMSTKAVQQSDVAIKVVSRVISIYEKRKEAMCDVGAIGLSKDTGPSGGFGLIVNSSARGWKIGRTSQEHGLMVVDNASGLSAPTPVDLGQMVHIIPQHACLTAAQYPWYYVVEKGGEEVVDVWVPWKFW